METENLDDILVKNMDTFIIGMIVFVVILIIGMSLTFLRFYISERIHDSYHKGYSDSMYDKYTYYKRINELKTTFSNYLESIKQDNAQLSIISNDFLIKHKELINEYLDKLY